MNKWYFQDRQADDRAGQDDDDSPPPGLISLPEALLERHGARVLDPSKAAALYGDTTPRPTIYRARTLLVADHLLQNEGFLRAANDVLVGVGMALRAPMQDRDLAEGEGEIIEELRRLPRAAVLVPREGHPTPVVVDAWVALQALRKAASPDHPHLNDETLPLFSLDRIATGSGIIGSPITNGGGGISGNPGSGADVSGPSTTDSYLFSGGDPRTPVALLLNAPAYKSDAQCESEYGGRPVVAVLDTGIRAHDWLGVTPNPAGGYDTAPGGPVVVDPQIQAAIYEAGQQAIADGDKPRRLIKDPWDAPMAVAPLVGELNSSLGHGTFIAGIVRQVAPDARVLAVRVMYSDDVAYESDVLCALRHLAKRIALGAAGDVAAMVHVISMSFGYFSESSADEAETSALWQVIRVLLRLGVIVVAAAGNYATSRKFYPAAFAAEPVPPDEVPVISVGALNPNGTNAVFSNDGPWVTAKAVGAHVISTYPTDVNASRSPELKMPVSPPPGVSVPGREALDPDDFTCGWAIWSGTSFSAPYLAAQIVGSLLAGAARPGSGLRLDIPGGAAGVDPATARARRKGRAVAAVENLRQQGSQGG